MMEHLVYAKLMEVAELGMVLGNDEALGLLEVYVSELGTIQGNDIDLDVVPGMMEHLVYLG